MATMQGGFASQIRVFKAKAAVAINKQCYAISRQLFLFIVELSPDNDTTFPQKANFAKGYLKNNWYPTDGAAFSSDEGSSADQSGSASKARILGLKGSQFLLRDGTVTLANNVKYAFRAEYDGWPEGGGPLGLWKGTRKPYAMIARSLILMQGKYPYVGGKAD
jgi:hypothetical protein